MLNHDIKENFISLNSMLSCLSIKGTNNNANVLNFLNNLVISDLKDINNEEFQFSALCNPKGRIISTFWIYIVNNLDIKIICPENMQKNLMEFFNSRKFRLKINISHSSDIIVINTLKDCLELVDHSSVEIKEATNEDFYLFLFNQGLIWIDKHNSEKFIPQHVNLDLHKNAMSFTKGCYPGQEIIARIKYLGKIKKRVELFDNKNKEALIQSVEKFDTVSPIIYDGVKNIHYIQSIKKVI